MNDKELQNILVAIVRLTYLVAQAPSAEARHEHLCSIQQAVNAAHDLVTKTSENAA
jgi:hypothetical protein